MIWCGTVRGEMDFQISTDQLHHAKFEEKKNWKFENIEQEIIDQVGPTWYNTYVVGIIPGKLWK